MAGEWKYIFGPVPSRRLGLSLGVDIVPFKVCSLDCLYCQIGVTSIKTVVRQEYVDVEAVLVELREKLAAGVVTDYITISGSGEPTLNSQLGEIITRIKQITDVPVAVLTNGTLFTDRQVRAECALADLVVPSLDAVDQECFCEINRPALDIDIENVISSLVEFRAEYSGQMWLEVFLIEDINTSPEQISKIKAAVNIIRPDKVQLNTAVRPTAVGGLKVPSGAKLREIALEFGPDCEVIAEPDIRLHGTTLAITEEEVFSMLKRRPCSVSDVCAGLGISKDDARGYLEHLEQKGLVEAEKSKKVVYFKAR